jgi:hypothetical protein
VTNQPKLAANVGLESPTYMKAADQNSTKELTVARENLTNELSWRRGGTQPHENGVRMLA